MMIKVITSGLLFLISRLIDKDVIDAIKKLVAIYMANDGLAGHEKKERVTAALNELHGEVAENVSEMAGWLLSTAIDIVHGYLEVRK